MEKKYGVKMTLPDGNAMSLPHLLGHDFAAERWFETDEARQQFLDMYQKHFLYYRKGDKPTLEYVLMNIQK